jgi:hypothetical protein
MFNASHSRDHEASIPRENYDLLEPQQTNLYRHYVIAKVALEGNDSKELVVSRDSESAGWEYRNEDGTLIKVPNVAIIEIREITSCIDKLEITSPVLNRVMNQLLHDSENFVMAHYVSKIFLDK